MVKSNQSQNRNSSIKSESIQELFNQIRVKTGIFQLNQSQYGNVSIKSVSIQERFNQIRVNTGTVQSNQSQYMNCSIKSESMPGKCSIKSVSIKVLSRILKRTIQIKPGSSKKPKCNFCVWWAWLLTNHFPFPPTTFCTVNLCAHVKTQH